MNAEDFEPYIRTMPHAEYPSGSSCVCEGFRRAMTVGVLWAASKPAHRMTVPCSFFLDQRCGCILIPAPLRRFAGPDSDWH